jgi:hypothetical protein
MKISFPAFRQPPLTMRAVSPFPAPLRGRVRERGNPRGFLVCGTPIPNPSPQGGGEPTFIAATSENVPQHQDATP